MTNAAFLDEVYPGIFRVALAFPGNPMGQVNSYFIPGPERVTVIDVGYDHPACHATLDAAMHALGRSWDEADIVLTHSHADHIGGLDRVVKPTTRVLSNMHSFREVRNLLELQSAVYNPLLSYFAKPEGYDQREAHRRNVESFDVLGLQLPSSYQLSMDFLGEGDHYTNGDFDFEIIETPGHDDWHICLYDAKRKLLFSGDHLLEKTTPGIMTWLVAYDVLDEYFSSLYKICERDIELILPGHGSAFTGAERRAHELRVFHRKRLGEFYELVKQGYSSIMEITRHAHWRHPDWDSWTLMRKFYSMGETFAHLVYLVNEELVTLTICQNKYRFYPTEEKLARGEELLRKVHAPANETAR